MPMMRNPFRSKPNDQVYDENGRPLSERPQSSTGKGDSLRSQTRPLSIRTSSSGNSEFRPTEYKMSEINDSGVYMPPSPTEKKSTFWSTRSATSTRSSSTLNDNEPFSISRESFDSYRRSFDISARSAIISASTPPRPRQSLDARQMRLPSSGLSASSSLKSPARPSIDQRPRRPSASPYQPRTQTLPDSFVNPPTSQPEESEDAKSHTNMSPSSSATTDSVSTDPTTPSDSQGDRFEDVGLGESVTAGQAETKKQLPPVPQTKKPSIFARFGGSSDTAPSNKDDASAQRPGSSGLGIGLGMFGRKRGASGQGAELGSIPQPQQAHGKKSSLNGPNTAAGAPEVKPDS